jgi:hypothetical protein
MIDLKFHKDFVLRQLADGTLDSATGLTIRPGDLYLEDADGNVWSLEDTSPLDFFGDISWSGDDYETVTGTDLDVQDIYVRVFTDQTDFYVEPQLGANLSDLRGMFNEEATARLGIEKLMSALTNDGRFDPDDIRIEAVPIAVDRICFYIFLRTDDGVVTVPIVAEL